MAKSAGDKCFKCIHKQDNPGSAHIRCNNQTAKVEGNPVGIRRGWFLWPLNFDPAWLVSCDGFSDDPAEKLLPAPHNPLAEILTTLASVGR